jgi:hypothetical protein
MQKRHDEEMRPMLHPGDKRIRLAKVRLSMAWRMRQRHNHLPLATAPFANVILDDGLSSREAMKSILTKAIDGPILDRRNRTTRALQWRIIAPPFTQQGTLKPKLSRR